MANQCGTLSGYEVREYQRTRLDQYGSPRGYLMREKSIKGFQTGDRIVAVVTQGKKIGVHKSSAPPLATTWVSLTWRDWMP